MKGGRDCEGERKDFEGFSVVNIVYIVMNEKIMVSLKKVQHWIWVITQEHLIFINLNVYLTNTVDTDKTENALLEILRYFLT